ncbi:MAG: hypothetical protein RJB01_1437, partial [Actinomycetota bacterium]
TGRSVTPVDDASSEAVGSGTAPALSTETPHQVSLEESSLDIEPERPHLVSVPDLPAQPEASGQSIVVASDEKTDSAAPQAAPTKPKRPKRGRSSVPKWDEILFGTTRPED